MVFFKKSFNKKKLTLILYLKIQMKFGSFLNLHFNVLNIFKLKEFMFVLIWSINLAVDHYKKML